MGLPQKKSPFVLEPDMLYGKKTIGAVLCPAPRWAAPSVTEIVCEQNLCVFICDKILQKYIFAFLAAGV